MSKAVAVRQGTYMISETYIYKAYIINIRIPTAEILARNLSVDQAE